VKPWQWFLKTGDRHAGLAAALIVLAGLAYRFRVAAEAFLNPEEAFHSMLSANGDFTWLAATDIKFSHPPLLFFLLRFVQSFGYSEIVMRTPIVLAGGLAPWLLFLWVRRIRGSAEGLIALAILVISPNLFLLSTQLRGFMLVVFFYCLALYCLQRALDENSAFFMALFSAALCLAALSEYMAVIVCLATGLYCLLEIRSRSLASSVKWAWAAGQAVVAAVYVALAVLRLPTSWYSRVAQPLGYLEGQYGGHAGSPLAFFLEQTAQAFRYIFSSPITGAIGLVSFCFGVYFLWSGRFHPTGERGKTAAVLFITPFLLGGAVALLDVYPYGGSRHSLYLAPLAAAGAGIGLAPLCKRQAAVVCLAVAMLGPFWFLRGEWESASMPRMRKLREPFHQSLQFLKRNVPPGSVILADGESAMLLSHYFDPSAKWPRGIKSRTLIRAGSYAVFKSRWTFEGFDDIRADLAELKTQFNLPSERPVWVFDSGFHTAARLEWLRDPAIRKKLAVAREFGLGTFVFLAPPGFESSGPRAAPPGPRRRRTVKP